MIAVNLVFSLVPSPFTTAMVAFENQAILNGGRA
jgi:hypothetical protein